MTDLAAAKQTLIDVLREHSLVLGEVTLASGATAQYYVDARRTLISLTVEGQRLITKLMVNGPAVSRETLKPLNAQEQRQLLELLARLT